MTDTVKTKFVGHLQNLINLCVKAMKNPLLDENIKMIVRSEFDHFVDSWCPKEENKND